MFKIQIAISFIVGGLFIALQTIIAERVAPKWRAVILGLPSTLALGLFFIGLTKSSPDVVEVAKNIPAALWPDYMFVLVFALLSQWNILASFLGGYLRWTVSAFLLLKFPPETFFSSLAFYYLPFILIAFFLAAKYQKTSTSRLSL